MFKYIYLFSVMYSYVPKFIERMIYTHKLSKEGYYFEDKTYELADNVASLFVAIVSSLVPGINLLSGTKTLRRLKNMNTSYSDYKSALLINKRIKNSNVQSDSDVFNDTITATVMAIGFEDEKMAEEIITTMNDLNYIFSCGYVINDELKKLEEPLREKYVSNLAAKLREENAENKELNDAAKNYLNMELEDKLEYMRKTFMIIYPPYKQEAMEEAVDITKDRVDEAERYEKGLDDLLEEDKEEDEVLSLRRRKK